MKKLITITAVLVIATAAAQAQTRSAYQGVINSQSPIYYNTLDNTLAPSTGTGTFGATAGATFGSDYFGNPDSAVTFAASSDQLSYATGGNIINGSGTTTSIGSMSLLFQTPSTFGSTMYLLSGSDTSPSQFAVTLINGTLNIKIANKTFTAPTTGDAFPALTGNTWYYLALTWDCNGLVTGVNGVNYYLGVAGDSSIAYTGFMQKGGTGNFSSTGLIGNAGAFVLSGHQLTTTGGFTGGTVDELATWGTKLTSEQVNGQFSALITPVPEPSSVMLCGLGGLLAAVCARTLARNRGTGAA